MYLVSACLAGIKCRYDGTHYEIAPVKDLVKTGKAIPVCPEVISGLGIPRPASEIKNINNQKRVVNKKGDNVTSNFKKGAKKCLQIARILEIEKAILKSKSPSCGYKYVYDGTFSNTLRKGKGFTAELLDKNNIKIITEKDIKN